MSNLTALKCVWRNGCPNPRLCAELQCCGSLQVKKQPEALASNPATEALACFEAAFAEGWHEALANGDLVRIRDIWARRIMFAHSALCSPPETRALRTDHAANLATAAAAYVDAAFRLSNDGTAPGVWDQASDTWRGLKTALYEYQKHSAQKSKSERALDEMAAINQATGQYDSVPAATPPAPNAAPDGATNGSAAAGTVLPDRILKVPQ